MNPKVGSDGTPSSRGPRSNGSATSRSAGTHATARKEPDGALDGLDMARAEHLCDHRAPAVAEQAEADAARA